MEEMTELKEISSLQEANQAYKKVTGQIVIGFVAAGYILKKVRDKELYKEQGYADLYECAEKLFNTSRSWTDRFMQINDAYSIGGNSPEIQEKYDGYGSSKLSEMLTLPENIREEVPVTATVKEIREVKKVVRDTEGRYSPQMSLCDVAQNQEEPILAGTWGKELIKEFFKSEGKPCFEKMWMLCKNPEDCAKRGEKAMAIVAPTKFRMFRMQRANALFGESKIQIMPYNGQGEKENLNYIELTETFWEVFEAESAAEAYQAVYNEPLKEKKEREVIKAEKLKKEPEKERKNETAKEKLSNSTTTGIHPETEKQKEETSKKEPETAETRSAEPIPERTKPSKQIEVNTEVATETVEEQIPGQMELTRDMPQYCPEGQQGNAEETTEQPGDTTDEGQQATKEEPESPFGSRKQYLNSLNTYGMALYMAASMQTLPHMRMNFPDFWEKWLSAEVDDNGEEIEVVE